MRFEIIKQVWQDKWEVILALVGIVAAFWRPIGSLAWGAVGILLVIDVVGKVIHELRLARERNVPLIVFATSPGTQGAPLDAYNAMVGGALQAVRRAGFDEGEFVNRFGVTRDEWALWRDTMLPIDSEEWRMDVQRFNLRVQRMSSKLGEQRVFHLFLQCPSALAMSLGAILGSHHRFVVYQYLPGASGGPYVPVFETPGMAEPLRVRLGKEIEQPYRYITVEPLDEVTPEVYVSIFLARHSPSGELDQAAREADSAVLHIHKSDPAALTEEDDWFLAAREVASVLFGLIGRAEVKRVHLALSCPVAVAFLIGVALGTHSSITVYNWFAHQCALHPVLALDQLDPSS